MKKDNLIFIGYTAYGDYLSLNGFLRFLLNYYKKIYYYIRDEHISYLKELYNDVFDKIDFVNLNYLTNYMNTTNDFNVFNICLSDNCKLILKNLTDNTNYYNSINKLTKLLEIDTYEYKNDFYINNHISFYIANGFDPNLLVKSN
jgi:hypothetical protein